MAYGTNELLQSASGIPSPLRCIPKLIKAATIAAIAGAPLLAKLTPMAFNTSTSKWQVWTALVQDIWTLSFAGTVSGGTFTLSVNSETTSAIAFGASNATILAALVALGNVDDGDFTLSGGPIDNTHPLIITASPTGNFARKAVTIAVNGGSLTGGGTASVAHTTTGTGANGLDIPGAFVWPEAVQTDATNDTLSNLMFAGEIHLDDIVVPSGETLANLKTAINSHCRIRDFNIQGIIGFR